MQMPEEDNLDIDFTNRREGMVRSVTIRETDDPSYPCSWKYSLHFGDMEGNTVLHYDNAHEDTKGHERHTADGVELIDFPGMHDLYDRFKREVREWWREQG